jgi:hypothetical protein
VVLEIQINVVGRRCAIRVFEVDSLLGGVIFMGSLLKGRFRFWQAHRLTLSFDKGLTGIDEVKSCIPNEVCSWQMSRDPAVAE